MKKFLLFLCLCLSVVTRAENVTESRARSVATSFLKAMLEGSRGGTLGGTRSVRSSDSDDLQLDLIYDGGSSRSSQAAPFYVFNNRNGKGFVIVSGDDCTRPILGFSTTDRFVVDAQKDGSKGWLAHVSMMIESVRSRSGNVSSRSSQEWTEVPCYVSEPAVRYESVLWGNRAPFNSELPLLKDHNGNRVRACFGDFEVCLAIVFRHREWPDKGRGTVPGYDYEFEGERINIQPRVLGDPYLWNKMPLDVDAVTPKESCEQIARLMTDLASMVKSCHTVWGGWYDWDAYRNIAAILQQYMDVSPDVRMIKRRFFTAEKWQETILKSLKEVGPLLYEANGCYVIDGYLKDGFYHLNFADNGRNNGYYLLEPVEGMDDFFVGTGGNVSALVDVRKNQGNVAVSDNVVIENLMALTDKVELGERFSVKAENICYFVTPFAESEIEVVPWLVDRNGVRKMMIAEPVWFKYVSPEKGWYQDFLCVINGNIEADDRIRLFYRSKLSSDWKPTEQGDYWIGEVVFRDNQGTIETINGKIAIDIDRKSNDIRVVTDEGISVKVIGWNGDLTDKCTRNGNVLLVQPQKINNWSVSLIFKEGKALKRVRVMINKRW